MYESLFSLSPPFPLRWKKIEIKRYTSVKDEYVSKILKGMSKKIVRLYSAHTIKVTIKVNNRGRLHVIAYATTLYSQLFMNLSAVHL